MKLTVSFTKEKRKNQRLKGKQDKTQKGLKGAGGGRGDLTFISLVCFDVLRAKINSHVLELRFFSIISERSKESCAHEFGSLYKSTQSFESSCSDKTIKIDDLSSRGSIEGVVVGVVVVWCLIVKTAVLGS